MPQIIIEEYARGGIHHCYHRISELPVHIGRAYNNDIVIADPYVSPLHLIIEKGEHGWIAVDQGSKNGSFVRNNSKITGTAELVSGDTISIGRTLLRLWSPEHPVPGELRLPSQRSPVRRAIGPLLAFLSLAGVWGALTIQQFLNNANQIKPISLFASALPYLFFPLLWAGICSCAGFIVLRKAQFSLQLIVANGALVCILALTLLSEYVDYFTCSTLTADIIQYTGMMIITAMLLFINLSITTGTADLRRAIISFIIGGSVIAAVALNDYAARFENRITPEYSQTLKPPYAKIAQSEPLDGFILECESLFNENIKQDPQGKL
jgi:pSer/pThr/pTyr-binding forkhead associated (FHA) protein